MGNSDPDPEDLELGEAIVAAFGRALAEACIKHGDQLLTGFMSGRIRLLLEHDGMTILEKDVDPNVELGLAKRTPAPPWVFGEPPAPLPADHPAWHTLLGYLVDGAQRWPKEARDAVMPEILAGVDCLQEAIADGLVVVVPTMRADGMYYEVRVRTDGVGDDEYYAIARIHSVNLGTTDVLLAADEWLANARALAEEPPYSPEGIEGA